jgi:hypothetical protein
MGSCVKRKRGRERERGNKKGEEKLTFPVPP